jgi:hypothetical protein
MGSLPASVVLSPNFIPIACLESIDGAAPDCGSEIERSQPCGWLRRSNLKI